MDDHYILIDGSIKCVHCKCTWKTLSTTSKRAHLSNKEFAILYKVTWCKETEQRIDPQIKIENIDHFMNVRKQSVVTEAQKLKRDRHLAFSISSTASNDSSYVDSILDSSSLDFPKKNTRQSDLYEYVNPVKAHDADVSIAIFFYRCAIPFECANTLAFKKMVESIKHAPATYVPPLERKIRINLLDETYENVKVHRDGIFEDLAKKGIGITLTTDGATISKRPLSNICAAIPGRGTELITYDDASEHMQNGGKKDARYYAELVKDAVEELGPKNIATIVTDNASVMLAFWEELQPLYPWFFFVAALLIKETLLSRKYAPLLK